MWTMMAGLASICLESEIDINLRLKAVMFTIFLICAMEQ